MYVLPTVHISIGLEGNLAEACDVDGLRYAYSRSLSDQQQASRLHCTSYTHVPVTYIHSSARVGTLSVCLPPPVSKEAARTSSLDNLENVFDHGT